MTLATTYSAALCLAIFSLLCLGSWANSLKLASRWRFELFYFDFSFGLAVTSLVLAFTAGSLGYDSFIFMDDVMRASKHSLAYAFGAGLIFNLGNMLLIAGMSLVGMSIAFPIGLGIATIVGALVAYAAGSQGNPVLVLTGAAVVLVAVLVCAFGYRSLSLLRELEKMKAGEHRTLRPSVSWKGVFLSVAGGIVLGSFTPLLDMARDPDIGLGPYSVGVMFCMGIAFSTVLYNMYFMNLPVKGQPLEILAYFRGTIRQHLYGVLGGVVWSLGTIAALVLSGSPKETLPGPAVSYTLARSSPLLAAIWGLVFWKESRGADARVTALMGLMLFLLAAGLTMLAIAPLYAPI
jgi:glucose uptake protein